jgi:hypothetical protein
MSTKKPTTPRKITALHCHPSAPVIVAVADDGTLWLRSAHVGESKTPWRELPMLPPINPPEESEDAITITV